MVAHMSTGANSKSHHSANNSAYREIIEFLLEKDDRQVEHIQSLEEDLGYLMDAARVNDECAKWERVMLRRLRNIARERQGDEFDPGKVCGWVRRHWTQVPRQRQPGCLLLPLGSRHLCS